MIRGKVEAAHLLHLCGWTNEQIARATASPVKYVERWLGTDQRTRRSDPRPHPCHSCGSEQNLQTNSGLCEPCLQSRNEAAYAMTQDEIPIEEIARSMRITSNGVKNILRLANDSVRSP